MIRPWIFEFFPTYGDEPQAAFAWHLDLWTRCQDIGFEGIFFSEHHFGQGRLTPSPNLLIAAVAARTTTLRLGAMGMVLPLYEPWRVAEEIAMLDHLSGGRFEMGFSSGAGPMEPVAVGIPIEDIRPRFIESLEVLDKALTQAPFSHHGQFFNYDNLSIVPLPLQQPTPRGWMTCVSTATAELAGARGYNACTGFLPTAEAKVLFEARSAAAAKAGLPSGPAHNALRRQILVARTDDEGKDIAAAATAKLMAMFGRGRPHADTESGTASAAPDAPPTPRGLFFGEDETITGSPATVAEQIIAQCRASGAGHILGYPFISALKADVGRSYELWREVIPILRKA